MVFDSYTSAIDTVTLPRSSTLINCHVRSLVHQQTAVWSFESLLLCSVLDINIPIKSVSNFNSNSTTLPYPFCSKFCYDLCLKLQDVNNNNTLSFLANHSCPHIPNPCPISPPCELPQLC